MKKSASLAMAGAPPYAVGIADILAGILFIVVFPAFRFLLIGCPLRQPISPGPLRAVCYNPQSGQVRCLHVQAQDSHKLSVSGML